MQKKNKKIRVAILFGGKSAEHEVSLQSAKNVIEAMDKNKYDVTLVGIGKDGRWLTGDRAAESLLGGTNPKFLKLKRATEGIAIIPGENPRQLIHLNNRGAIGKIDVVFPVLHGTFGEDGTVQGLLKLMNVAFVGPSVLGSAIGMDKDASKRLLRDAGIPVADFFVLTKANRRYFTFEAIKSKLGSPFFLKPANLGSSVGVHKVRNEDQFKESIRDAFFYDNKVLAEKYIKGRELECSVLGNENPAASVAGEVIPLNHEFYSYEAKYIDDAGAALEIPARISSEMMKDIKDLAIKAFVALCCEGMARIDFFLQDDGKLFINEINTIPGFTKISMYPKLWEASGLPYPKLIDKLIALAIERFAREQKLKTTYES